MTGKRKRYSADFKAKVALEALKGELTLSQLAAKHGVHQTMIAAVAQHLRVDEDLLHKISVGIEREDTELCK